MGECLLRAGLISDHDLRAALAEHRRTGERIGAVLVRLNLLADWQIARALAHQLGLPYTNFCNDPPEPAAIALIPRDVASRRLSVGTRVRGERLTVAMADPMLFGLVQDLEARTNRRIDPVVATSRDIMRVIRTAYPGRAGLRARLPEHAGADCRKCHRILEAGWQFCPFCAARTGARLAAPAPLPDAASL